MPLALEVGRVATGASAADESMLRGESLPIDEATGDPVFAGTVNSYGAPRGEVTTSAAGATPARMIELVTQAQEDRSRGQRFVDRFGRLLGGTPGVRGVRVPGRAARSPGRRRGTRPAARR